MHSTVSGNTAGDDGAAYAADPLTVGYATISGNSG
jgi:hypothetical protein